MYDSLTRLAVLYGTDKFGLHDYTPNYYKMFKHLKDAPVRVLEIGVGGYSDDDRGGQSLEMWRDFFTKGEITGIDIQKKSMDLGPRVKILQGSQVDPEFLQQLVAERGPFDIIIDDGSHRNEHIVESWELLFPTLNPGGIYVAEDVQTSFFPRFGGSLELTSPNSVGYFGEIFGKLGAQNDAPLARDIASMERYHNMIALHKRGEDKGAPSPYASPVFDSLIGTKPQALIIGDTTFDPKALPFKLGKVSSKDWGSKSLKKKMKKVKIVIATLPTVGASDPTVLSDLLGSLAEQSICIIHNQGSSLNVSSDSEFVTYVRQRFTLVDHREMVVHFPDANVDKLANKIYGIERFPDAVLFHKASNSYPSNFAYNPDEDQVKKAIAKIEEVLREEPAEGGLIQLAMLLWRHNAGGEDRDEKLAETLASLEKIGASSRVYYQISGNFFQGRGLRDEAMDMYRKALEKFPKDPMFTVSLSRLLMAQNDLDEAEELLHESLETNPRARQIFVGLEQVASRQGDWQKAAKLAKHSLNLFPRNQRAPRQIALSKLYRKIEEYDAAERLILRAIEFTPEDANLYEEMSHILLAMGRDGDAKSYYNKFYEMKD